MKKYVDLEEIIKEENPQLYHQFKNSTLPVFPLLKYLLRESKFNKSLNRHEGNDLPFIKEFLGQELGVSWKVHGEEKISPNQRYIFVSNHSHGGVDGLVFIAAVSQLFPEVRILVNRVLAKIEKLRGVFLPINVFSNPVKGQYNELQDYLTSPHPLLIFPAGAVSRKRRWIKWKDTSSPLIEKPWKKSFLDWAITYKRDIVPTFIDIQNSHKFYVLAALRSQLRLEYNLEMFLLPWELYKFKNRQVNVHYSTPISYRRLLEELNYQSSAQITEGIQNFVMSRFQSKLF